MACFFIALFLSPVVFAQQLPLETYTPTNGLADARVNKMFQDKKGRIYFLTREGFSIFDGQRFENYGNDEQHKSEIFNDATEYADGTVKLFSFDGNTYIVKNNTISIDSSQRKLLSEVNKVFDIGNDEKLIATNYYLLRETRGHLKILNVKMPLPRYLGIESGAVFHDFLIFTSIQNSSQSKVYLYNYVTQQIKDSLNIRVFSNIRTDKKNNIFFYSDKWNQLNLDSLEKGKLKKEPPYFAHLITPEFGIFNIQFDNENNVWLNNADKGYCMLNMKDNSVKYFSITQGILSSPKFVYQDMENNYWFISSGSGVQKLQRSSLTKISTLNNVNINQVVNICADENYHVFINSQSGLFLDDKKIYPTGFINNNVYFWQNQFWNFTDYKTLTGSKGITIHLDKLINNYELFDHQVSYITIDKLGRMIIAGKIFIIINKDFSAFAYRLPYFCDNIIADENDIFWCFLRSNSVLRMTIANNRIIQIDSSSINELQPRYALKWNSNTFVVATRLKGVMILQWQNGQFKAIGRIDKKDGLSNNFVNVLVKKGVNRLIAGTATGLDIISITNKDTILENLSARNSIFSSFNNLVYAKDSSVICQTIDGLLFKLDNTDRLSSSFIPTAFFKKIIVNNQSVDAEKQNNFSYLFNNFKFSVSAPAFLDNRNTRFKFVLTGSKGHWEQHTANADFAINNLLPGNYHLIVTVQFPGKFYPDQQLIYDFTINPPFWKQWWFIILSALLTTLAIFFAISNFYKKQFNKQKNVLEKELAIEQERTRMSRELHDGLGSMLSGIKHSFSAMKNQLELNDNQENRFSYNIDRLNESILDLRNLSHSMASDSLLKYGLDNSVEDYCRNISEPGVINISYNAIDTEKMQLTEEQTFHLFRIIQELLQNVIKHARAVNTIVQISYNAGHVYITVEDDGRGFDMGKARKRKGLGLKNIDTRIKILNGKIDFDTSKGTSVMIEIPCTERK